MKIQPHGTQGFTLLELLVVVGLLAMVAGVALMAYEGVREDAAYTATRAEMMEIKKALLQFRNDVGHFPDAAGLIAPHLRITLLSHCQSTDPSKVNTNNGVSYDAGCSGWNRDTRRGWHGPYLMSGAHMDAWGNAYLLLDSSDSTPSNDADGVARLVSLGWDGLDGAGGVQNVASDGCTPVTGSDDIVVCLLK